MTERKEVLSLGYYGRAAFKGSDGKMRYKIEKIESEETGKQLQVTLWPGPLCFEVTDESLMETHVEEFSEEGMELIISYMNERSLQYNN